MISTRGVLGHDVEKIDHAQNVPPRICHIGYINNGFCKRVFSLFGTKVFPIRAGRGSLDHSEPAEAGAEKYRVYAVQASFIRYADVRG